MTIKANTQPSNVTPPAETGGNTDPANIDVPVGGDAPAEGEVVIQEVAPKPKVISVPTSAMKKIKEAAAAEGRTAYQRELDAQAVELGYKDHAAWVQATKEARAASTAKPSSTAAETTQPAAATSAEVTSSGNPELDALRQENQRLSSKLETEIQDKKRINRQFARQKRAADRLANELLAKEGETELKLAAKDAGVVDVDYAVTVFQRSIAGMTEEELKGVDEKKFFSEQLRKTHPHLYTPVTVPVNTGTKNSGEIQKPSASGPGPAPAPGNGQGNGPIDARTLTTDAFHALLRKKGLSIPGTGGAIG